VTATPSFFFLGEDHFYEFDFSTGLWRHSINFLNLYSRSLEEIKIKSNWNEKASMQRPTFCISLILLRAQLSSLGKMPFIEYLCSKEYEITSLVTFKN
jgi:hypothetical protein